MAQSAENSVVFHLLDIDVHRRESQKQQKAMCLWLTGLSGAGKTTLANELDRILYSQGCHAYVLDGDNLRCGISSDLGFNEEDRSENIRRAAEITKILVDAGLIVIVSLISPFRGDRSFARSIFEADRFFEIYINTPLSVCEERDPKGLYKKARGGAIKNFTGIDSPYEPPVCPEMIIETEGFSISQCAEKILASLSLVKADCELMSR